MTSEARQALQGTENKTELELFDLMKNWTEIDKTAKGDLKSLANEVSTELGRLWQIKHNQEQQAKQARLDAKANLKLEQQAKRLHVTVDDLCLICGGTGDLPYFNHVQGGRCFTCKGTGLK